MSRQKWTADNIESQEGRVAIVTGANSGIGFETAKVLAFKGARVILGCRSSSRGNDAVRSIRAEFPEADIEMMKLDLASLESVRNFCTEFQSKFTRLDLLINNAGVMMPPYTKTVDGFELQLGINHMGHFALTGLLLDKLNGTASSRVVMVSSLAHKSGNMDFDDLNWETRPYKRWSSYGASKLANLLFMNELQQRFVAAGLSTIVTSAHPGWTGTNLQKNMNIPGFVNKVFPMKAWQGALPTLFAATSPQADGGDFIGPMGFMEMRGYPGKVKANKSSRDPEVSCRLFDVSQELTGVRFDFLPSSVPQ